MSITSSSLPAAYTPESTLGSIVAGQPALAVVFESLGLDYCCGGKQSLAAACARKSLDVQTVVRMLATAATSVAASHFDKDVTGLTLTQLADHIEQTHHVYVRQTLPRLLEMSERVARKHGWRDARLADVHRIVEALTLEMMNHMEKEEVVLFPLIRLIEDGKDQESAHCGSVSNPIRQMEVEHEDAGQALVRLRELTNDFTPGPDDCNTHRGLLAGLAEFEADLHRHVHKENNLLFPRALARAGEGPC